jgi:hypothetical protein
MTPITTITNNGTIQGKCPSCYAELKTRHYIRMLKEWEDGTPIEDRDYFKLFCILTDDKFTGYEKTVENQVSLTNLLGWVITEPFEFSDKRPKFLTYQNKTIEIPEHPRELSIGQNIILRRDYIDKSKHLEENVSIATAIYLQPLIDNSLFKISRAKEIAKEIDEMPINLIYPIGFFLLVRTMKFGERPEKTLPQVKTNLRATLRTMWRDWLKFTF